MDFDWLLIKAFIFCDLAIIGLSGLVIVRCLPSRIRHAINKNSRRLDGTLSLKRAGIEQAHLHRLIAGSIVWLTIILLSVNVAIYFAHRELLPLPLGAASLAQFEWNQQDWSKNLRDPAKGNVAHRFDQWQESKSRTSRYHLTYLVTLWPIFILVGGLILISVLITWARDWIKSLAEFERQMEVRHRRYFAIDMKSRMRAVETSVSGSANADTGNSTVTSNSS